MTDSDDDLAASFDSQRGRLRQVAFRMLGSLAEADDAVQEAWLRLRSTDAAEIGNLGGWLTTVVSRISLDMLRARNLRREERLIPAEAEPILDRDRRSDPEQEALLAEAVGIGLMVVLERLEPPERIAFVLHDVFGVDFETIAPIVGRSGAAARQLASRARRRLQTVDGGRGTRVAEQRRVVGAFFEASRQGDFSALMRLLDPEASLHVYSGGASSTADHVTTGAAAIARRARLGAAARGRWSALMLVEGEVGIVVAPFGQARLVMLFQVNDDCIHRIDVLTDPKRIAGLSLGLLDRS